MINELMMILILLFFKPNNEKAYLRQYFWLLIIGKTPNQFFLQIIFPEMHLLP